MTGTTPRQDQSPARDTRRAALDRQGPARVVVVDDSPTMRGWLAAVLNSDHRLEVVGQACDAYEARAVIKSKSPDVITLDIEMPRMNGLEFLERIMRLRPMPVVMISALTSSGTRSALQALSLGAVDCIGKPGSRRDMSTQEICDKVYTAANAHVPHAVETPRPVSTTIASGKIGADNAVVLVGASTGGVSALETLLSGIPETMPPVIIAQHMPEHFLQSFATRLDAMLPQDVQVANDGETLARGQVRLAPAGALQTEMAHTAGKWSTRFTPSRKDETYTPSVGRLFASAVGQATQVVALMLTGLGNDGAIAMKNLRTGGAKTLGQSAGSCAVYGMPRAAMEAGAIMEEVSIERMPDRLVGLLQSGARG